MTKKKKNKLVNTIALFVVLCALGGVAWWLYSTQETAVDKKTVSTMNAKNIISFEVSRNDSTGKPAPFALELKKDNTWWMTSPVNDQMNPSSATEMVNVFAKFQAEDTIKEPDSLADYGLDKPTVTVTVNLANKKSFKFLIGAATALPNKYYVKFDNKSTVYVVDAVTKSRFDQDARFFRQNAVATLDKDKIQEIRIKNKAGAGYADYVVKRVKDKWTLVKPFAEKIMADKPDQILSSLPTIFSQEFIDNVTNLGEYGLDQPEFQVDLVQDDGKTMTVKANKVNDNWYLTNSLRSTVFKVVGTETMDFMKFDLPYQFERKLVEYVEKDAKSIEYKDANGKITLFTGDDFRNYWAFASTLMASASFYYAKEGDQIPVTVSQFEESKVKPLCQVTFNLKRKNPDKLVLIFYPYSKTDSALVTSSARSYVYEFPKIDVDTLNTKANDIIKANKDKKK